MRPVKGFPLNPPSGPTTWPSSPETSRSPSASSTNGPTAWPTCWPSRARAGGRLGGDAARTRSRSSCAWRRRPSSASPSVTVNWHLRADELAWILDDSGAERAGGRRDSRRWSRRWPPSGRVPVLVGRRRLRERLAGAPADPVPYAWPTSWPVIYTSGTPGRPKGVVHGAGRARASWRWPRQRSRAVGLPADDVHLVAGPAVPRRSVRLRELDALRGRHGGAHATVGRGASCSQLVDEHRVTTTSSRPRTSSGCSRCPTTSGAAYDLSSLRPRDPRRRAVPGRGQATASSRRFPDAEIWELYGASEAARPASRRRGVARAAGQRRPAVARRRGADRRRRRRRAAPTGGDGRDLHRRRPTGGSSTTTTPRRPAEAWRDGAFTVGDIGHLDDDGYLYLTDRAADMVIRGGVNMYPREIEEVLHRTRRSSTARCSACPTNARRAAQGGGRGADARSTPTSSPASAASTSPTSSARPRFELVDELPRDPNGKVLKRLLREQAWAGRAA